MGIILVKIIIHDAVISLAAHQIKTIIPDCKSRLGQKIIRMPRLFPNPG